MLKTKEQKLNNKTVANKKRNIKKDIVREKGITLIALVITIIILIILASVAIYLSLGNNGIFTKAKEAKELTNKQEATDIINLKITTAQMNKYADEQRMPTLKELSEVLKEDNEILYVTETSQIASTKYEVGENPSSIFTKLNDYPYEFEINSSLQLASINGVKTIANNNTNNANWTLLKEGKGITSEENSIELPSDFSELLIKIAPENKSLDHYAYTFLINRQMLTDNYERYANGFGAAGNTVGAIIKINNKNIYADSYKCYSNVEAVSSTILSVYYR